LGRAPCPVGHDPRPAEADSSCVVFYRVTSPGQMSAST